MNYISPARIACEHFFIDTHASKFILVIIVYSRNFSFLFEYSMYNYMNKSGMDK